MNEFRYTKSWTRASDFPAIETSEAQAREDIQFLYDEIAEGLNDVISAVKSNLTATSDNEIPTSRAVANHVTTKINNLNLSQYAKTADLTPYAKTADLAPYAKTEDLAAVATSGSYSDITGKPSLAAVATSGSYTDLSDKPAIPKITVSSADPTGGSNGDIWIKYEG